MLRLRRFASTIAKCPKPTYDTGCTHCMPNPEEFAIDVEKPLPPKPLHAKQLLICTNTSDWPSQINSIDGSIAQAIFKRRFEFIDPHAPVLITNCDLPFDKSVIWLPDHVRLDDVDPTRIERVFARGDKPTLPQTKITNPIILICGHGSRDQRCGVIAPLLVDEFKKVLAKESMLYDKHTNPDGAMVSICSHIGGHAFAGNVIIHFGDGSPSVWCSRVLPSHVQGLVSSTLKQRVIIEELTRPTLNR